MGHVCKVAVRTEGTSLLPGERTTGSRGFGWLRACLVGPGRSLAGTPGRSRAAMGASSARTGFGFADAIRLSPSTPRRRAEKRVPVQTETPVPSKGRTSGILAAALLALLPLSGAWSADAERGRALYGECRRCHQAGGGAEHRIGPHLNDLFGRVAGSLEDYRYSPAMTAAGAGGLVWTESTLDAFLADPHALVPRSRMSFAGMEGADERADLLAWLRGFSGGGSGLPPAEPTATPEEYGLDPELLAIPGDPEYGAYLAGECITCHRGDGAAEGIPSITGWPHDDFVIALQAYKHGKREHPVMQLVAGRLSDEEIAALAAHFRKADNQP